MRPNIWARLSRARLALLALGFTCAVVGAPLAVAEAMAPAGASPLGVTPLAGIPVPALVGAVSASVAPVGKPASLRTRVKLTITRTDLNVLAGRPATVAGSLRTALSGRAAAVIGSSRPSLEGRVVAMQRRAHRGWITIASVRTGVRGRFVVRYVPRGLFSERVRVVFAGDAGELPARRDLGTLSSYRLAVASWYGGGGGLACGGELTSATMGVANKTLPCGTLVTLRYDGRSVRVPVVDRGPYVAGREFDLTEATKRALGFEGVGVVWSTR